MHNELSGFRLAVIFTTYKPEANFIDRISKSAPLCNVCIVVDNTPGGYVFHDTHNIVIIQDGVNKGLGNALNIGIREAKRRNCNFAMLFDQDSSPDFAFIKDLKIAYSALSFENLCIGPTLIDDGCEITSSELPKNDRKSEKYVEVTCLPTSGMFFPIENITDNDFFSEELFLDFVDFDWCWRMRSKGWRYIKATDIQMRHRLGIEQRKFLGITFHVPATYRHYYQFRDTLNLLFLSYVPLYSKFKFGIILIPKILLYPFILDNGIERLAWMCKGIVDAISGKKGIGAAAERLQ